MSLGSRVQALENGDESAAAGQESPVRIYIPDNGRGPAPRPARPEHAIVVYIPGGLNDPDLETQAGQDR